MGRRDQRPILTPKQHLFVQAIVKGATQSAAYKKAGFTAGSTNSAATQASRLAKKAHVQSAIEAARASARDISTITAADIVMELEEARIGAMNDGVWAAAVAASMGKAKLLGLIIERKLVGVVMAKPALMSQALELSEEEWIRQFDPAHSSLPPRQNT